MPDLNLTVPYQYTYDPLNVMKYLQSDTGLARVFLYDADDERIMTFDCAFVEGACATTEQLTTTIRGLDGKVLRIYKHPFDGGWDWERDYIYRDGQLLASVEPAGEAEEAFHFHLDHLGSPRQITTEAGAQAAFHSYYPFGGEATDPSQDDVGLKFTGHERDDNGSGGSSVLDYMHARYCSPALARFLSIDPLGGRDSGNPQSWNRYTYGLDNPVVFVDPNGKSAEIFWEFQLIYSAASSSGSASGLVIGTSSGLLFAGSAGIGAGYLVNQIPGVSEALTIPKLSDFLADVILKMTDGEKPAENQEVGSKEARNPAQDKRLTRGEIEKLKEAGLDPEELKEGRRTGKLDIFKDRDGNLFVKPKDGTGFGEELGLNINDLFYLPAQ